jgi:hypothetical protein
MADVAPMQDGGADASAPVSTNGNGTPHSEPAGPPPSQPAPVTPLTPVAPEGEPDAQPPPPPPAAAEEEPATTGSVPPPGVA